MPAGEGPDEEAVYKKAVDVWKRTANRLSVWEAQAIRFRKGPVCLVFVADLHLGNSGTNYPRIFGELEMILQAPNTWLVTVGDLLDNFVIGKLQAARMGAEMGIPEEWALVRRYLRMAAPKLVLSVGGNHEFWAAKLTGIDYFAEVLTQTAASGTLYHPHDARVNLVVGRSQLRLRIRHKWRGSSIYNATHGIERAAKWDHDFDIGVGAHTHVSGLVREFNNAGKTGLALQCGSYKVVDEYAISGGFARPNTNTAVALIADQEGRFMGTSDLKLAVGMMSRLSQ